MSYWTPVKRWILSTLDGTVNRPLYIRQSSQTLHQATLGCLRMVRTGQDHWAERARQAAWLLLASQRPDGGFDNGYSFDFGYRHRRGESISPELVGLTALVDYAATQDVELVASGIEKAVGWVERFAFPLAQDDWAIPYGPYSSRDVVNVNGVSFACGALGTYLGQFGGTPQQLEIYHGFVRYLDSALQVDPNLPGRYWHYADQTDTKLSAEQRGKIDYYHQMQQVEAHALAEQVQRVDGQLDLIRDAADHVVAVHQQRGVVPYTPCGAYFGGNIHTWGLSSVAGGLLEAACLLPRRRDVYRQVSGEVGDWLMRHAYRDGTFVPVLSPDGVPVDDRSYVRSDAWVFNALAALQHHVGSGPWTAAIEPVWRRMASRSFSGIENHARPAAGRVVFKLLKRARQVWPAGASA